MSHPAQQLFLLHPAGTACWWVRTQPSMLWPRVGGMNTRPGEMVFIWALASELPTFHPRLTHLDLLALFKGFAVSIKNPMSHQTNPCDVLALPPLALLPFGFPPEFIPDAPSLCVISCHYNYMSLPLAVRRLEKNGRGTLVHVQLEILKL